MNYLSIDIDVCVWVEKKFFEVKDEMNGDIFVFYIDRKEIGCKITVDLSRLLVRCKVLCV